MNFISNVNLTGNPPLRGRAVAQRLRYSSPADRALAALQFTNGIPIAGLTRAQAARVARSSVYNVWIASLAAPDEREALRRGRIKLRDVRAAHAKRKTPSEADIIAIINRIGPDAIMAALDRLTAPEPAAAAVE